MSRISEETYDVIVIGAGQAGLSMSFYLRRAGLNYIILDQLDAPDGAWGQAWQSTTPFLSRAVEIPIPDG